MTAPPLFRPRTSHCDALDAATRAQALPLDRCLQSLIPAANPHALRPGHGARVTIVPGF